MSKGENFFKNAKCKHGNWSAMSNGAWCDLNKNCNVLKLQDMCRNPKCNCQKQNIFTPKHFQLENGSIKSKLKSIFEGTQTAWNKFLMPGINARAPFSGMAVSANTTNPKVGPATTKILKSFWGGKLLLLNVMQGNGLRSKLL